jgi:AsmA protein
MKFLKKIIGLMLGLVIILLISLVVYAFVVDFNEYKPLISEKVEQATGRQLSIKGDIKIAIWPWLGLQVENAELSNAPGFGDTPFARVSKFDLKLELLPLLQKQINVDKILLHGLALSLQKNAQGKNNWDDLAQKKITEEPVIETRSKDTSLMTMSNLSVKGVEVKNGTLQWHDEKTQTKVIIDNVHLETGGIALNENVPVELSGHGRLNNPEADVDFNLSTDVNVDMDAMIFSMNQAAIDIRVLTPKLSAQNTQIKITSSLSANLNQQQYKINDLEMDVSTKGYQLPGGELNLKLKTSSFIDLIKQTAAIQSIQIESTGMHLTSSANISKLDTSPVIEGELGLAEFNPVNIANTYKISLPVMADEKALQKMKAKFKYRATKEQFELYNLSLALDDSVVTGEISVNNFSAPRISYNIKLNEIKADRYLPPIKASSKQRLTQSAGLSDVPIDLPVENLRKMNINGVFKADRIEWRDYKLEKLYVKAKGKKGVVVINPINVRLFGGKLAMATRLDVRGKKAKYSTNIKARKLQLATAAQPILKNVLNETKASLHGMVNFNAKFNAQGDSVHDLVSSLNGQFDFRTGKTQLKDADIENYLRQRVWYALDKKIRKSSKSVISVLKKNQFPTTEKEFMSEYRPRDKTAFNVIRARGTISEGVVNNYEFLMASDRVNVNGKGAIYLTNQRINYAAEIDLHRSNNSLKDQVLDIPLGVHLNGPFATLKPQADINGWLNKAWDVIVSDGKRKTKQKVKQKVKDKYKDMLKQWRN